MRKRKILKFTQDKFCHGFESTSRATDQVAAPKATCFVEKALSGFSKDKQFSLFFIQSGAISHITVGKKEKEIFLVGLN
jgi:hypothetical protein